MLCILYCVYCTVYAVYTVLCMLCILYCVCCVYCTVYAVYTVCVLSVFVSTYLSVGIHARPCELRGCYTYASSMHCSVHSGYENVTGVFSPSAWLPWFPFCAGSEEKSLLHLSQLTNLSH